MSDEEKIALKAPCLQAAATLKTAAATPGDVAKRDVTACVELARQLFEEITGTPWPKP
jgi:formiminotetrahydrofolate cyclodeaminase